MSSLLYAQFRSDLKRREVSGLVVPWGEVAFNQGERFRFQRGSLTWPADLGRLKLLRNHKLDDPVGVTLALDDRPDGLYGRFRIARGTAGDEALAQVADGVLDGFSAGPAIRMDRSGDARRGGDGVIDVHTAALKEISLTAMPSFADARVLEVAFEGGRPLAPMADEDTTGYHRSDPVAGVPLGTVTDDRWNARVARGGPRVRERLVTDRQTGEERVVREPLADPVPDAVTTALIKALGRGRIEPPDDLDDRQVERFWELVRSR